MTDIEKLDRLMEPIQIKIYDMGLHSNADPIVRRDTLLWAKEEARKACKEAGLKFVPDKWGEIEQYLCDDEHCQPWCHQFEQKNTLEAINSQIKEIE